MAENLKTEYKNEIATTRDGRDITRGFVDTLPLLPSTDRLLNLKGGGDLLIYQEVLRDEQVKACFEQRVRAVISYPWEVKPGGDKRIDKQAALFIEEQLKKINFDAITEKMLYGVFYGYAVAEPMYAVEEGRIVLDTSRGGIKVRAGTSIISPSSATADVASVRPADISTTANPRYTRLPRKRTDTDVVRLRQRLQQKLKRHS